MTRHILLAAVLWLGASTLALVATASKARKTIGMFEAGVIHSEETDLWLLRPEIPRSTSGQPAGRFGWSRGA